MKSYAAVVFFVLTLSALVAQYAAAVVRHDDPCPHHRFGILTEKEKCTSICDWKEENEGKTCIGFCDGYVALVY